RGIIGAIFILILERSLKRVSSGAIIGSFLGLLLGLLFMKFLLIPVETLVPAQYSFLKVALLAIGAYTGLLVGSDKGRHLSSAAVLRLFKGEAPEANQKILDTSVIIDGRIADVCETGFIEGTLIVPQFILRELQHVADSADPLKRARGRRGLDILHKMQKMSSIQVRIVEEDFPKIKEVDSKLLALAKLLNAKVITNDYNLNKLAQVQGVQVLNINELANALRPVVLPGEVMTLQVIKEGKERDQGVGYMEDGTMVVVENGRKYIGQSIEVVVTSVLQTTAGRMIFTKPKDEY
ncbi:MAG: PIN domain-containing protein, partial [Nitrospirae bacterium]